MADQLYLSYWIPGFSAQNMLRYYEKLLRLFPFSRLAQEGPLFRVLAVDYTMPAVVEYPFPPTVTVEDILAAAKEFPDPDVCYELEAWWDLWRFEGDWKLQPARAKLVCLGPEFAGGPGEDLSVEFGIDAQFLPQPELPNFLRMSQSNVRSLLKLVHDLDDSFATGKRQLWTESGENFADTLREALAATANKGETPTRSPAESHRG
jgi:hypothetical protein